MNAAQDLPKCAVIPTEVESDFAFRPDLRDDRHELEEALLALALTWPPVFEGRQRHS